jgi:hypothetical protein
MILLITFRKLYPKLAKAMAAAQQRQKAVAEKRCRHVFEALGDMVMFVLIPYHSKPLVLESSCLSWLVPFPLRS